MRKYPPHWLRWLLVTVLLAALPSVTWAARPFEGQELTVLYLSSGTYDAAARLLAPKFEEITGAKVTVIDTPWASMHEKVAIALATGSGDYDVIDVEGSWDGEMWHFFEPLNELMARDGIDPNDFITNVLRNSGSRPDGTIFGIPNATDAWAIIYRRDIFEERGIQPPTTWEEYKEIAAALTSPPFYGTVFVGAKEQLSKFWFTRLRAFGGQLFTPNWEIAFNDRAGVQAAQSLRDLLPYMPPGALSWDNPEVNVAFLNGDVAMAEVWPSFILGKVDDPRESQVVGKWGIFPPPGGSAEMSSWHLSIPKSARNKELAWEWIKMYTSVESQVEFQNRFGINPTRYSAWEEILKTKPYMAGMKQAIESVWPSPRIPQWPEMYQSLITNLSSVLADQKTAQQAISDTANEWARLLRRQKPDFPFEGWN